MADRRPNVVFVMADDPFELRSVYDDPANANGVAELRAELERLSDEVGDVAPAHDPRRRGAEKRS